jgi:hypothetical protein
VTPPRTNRPSPAIGVSIVALLVSLTGGAYAVGTLANNSVKSPQIAPGAVQTSDIAKNAVTSAKIKNGTLLAADFKKGQLSAGSKGDPGLPGTTGATGPAGAPGATGPRGPSSAFQARQSASLALTGADQTVLSLNLPAAGTYAITTRATVTAQNNPVKASCDSTTRGGAQVTLLVGATQIDTAATILAPDYVVFLNCIANAPWTQSTVVTTTVPKTVTILARDTLGATLTDSGVSSAAIVATQVESAVGATLVP